MKFILPLIVILTIFSCTKESNHIIDNQQEVKVYTSKVVKASQLLESDFDFNEELLEGVFDFFNGEQKSDERFLDCATVTFEDDFWKTPNVITVDFGTSCETPDGDILTGQIICNYNKFLNRTGAIRTISYNNFSLNGNFISGVETTMNLGRNDENYYVIQKDLVDGSISYEDDSNAYLNYSNTYTFAMSGPFTDLTNKNVVIEGNSSGTTIEGDVFTSSITTPLNLSAACQCINSGEKTVLVNMDLFTIDFGNNTCGAISTITLPDGSIEQEDICQE